MGTRSQLRIYRKTKSDIYLWMHWDGDFSGVGTDLCKQLQLLLKKYTKQQLQDMVEKLDLVDCKDYQCFAIGDLARFVEGTVSYMNDKCTDIQYTYSVSFADGIAVGHSRDYDYDIFLTLSEISDGVLFEHKARYEEEDE